MDTATDTTHTLLPTSTTRRFESELPTARIAHELVTFPKSDQDIPARFRPTEQLIQREYLAGTKKRWDGPLQTIYSPICTDKDGELQPRDIGAVPLLSRAASLEALDAAVNAYGRGRGAWPRMSSEQRITCVENFLDCIQEKRGEVIKLLLLEICKTEKDAAKEFDRTVEYIRKTIDRLRERNAESEKILSGEGVSARVSRGPRGVTLCMGPSNYPLNETFTTLFPALLMGNTTILKPAKAGVLLLQPMLEAFEKCFPPGVVNVIYGDGPEVIAPLMESGKIRTLAFIGSETVADALIRMHPAPRRLHRILGLGATNPAIILPGSDLAVTAKEGALGALGYNGQRCTALKRFFIPAAEAHEFVEKLGAEISNMRAGMPWETDVMLTPLGSLARVKEMRGYIDQAEANGARVVNPRGGEAHGTYIHPALLYPVNRNCTLWLKEQFGPIVVVIPYNDIQEVYDWIDESPYAQQASLFGGTREQRKEVGETLGDLVCRVNLDMQCQRGPDFLPFGAKEDSGEGTLAIDNALDEVSVPKVLGIKTSRGVEEILSFSM